MDRFRSNLVIEDTHLYVKDNWKEIGIGKVYFQVVKPCSRCVVATVDQETRKRGREPLKTLSG